MVEKYRVLLILLIYECPETARFCHLGSIWLTLFQLLVHTKNLLFFCGEGGISDDDHKKAKTWKAVKAYQVQPSTAFRGSVEN